MEIPISSGHSGIPNWLKHMPEITPEERFLVLSYLEVEEEDYHEFLQNAPLSLPLKEAAYLAQGDIENALALPMGEGNDAILRRMSLLLYITENYPYNRGYAQVLGEALFAAYPDMNGLKALHTKLLRNSRWIPITTIQSSAGLRFMEVTGWEPEEPTLRVRKTLFPPLPAGEQIIAGDNPFVLTNLHTPSLHLNLSLVEIDHLPQMPLTATYQIDQGQAESLRLTPDAPSHSISLDLPPGRHSVRIWIERPLVNQFLRAKVTQVQGEHYENLLKTTNRSYHVATHQEPLRFSLSGPTWLRIDELQDGTTSSRYLFLQSEDVHELELTPEDDQSEAIFRLFQRIPARNQATALPRIVKIEPNPLPDPLIELRRVMPNKLILEDTYRLGGQEDGTWSFSIASKQRIVLEDDSAFSGEAEKFVGLHALHRYFNPNQRTYFETDIFGRIRDTGGPTLGIKEHIRYRFNPSEGSWSPTDCVKRPRRAFPPKTRI